VTATNVGGAVVADNRYPTPVEPGPSQFPAYTEAEPTLPGGAETSGPVSVADRLPEGLEFAGRTEHDEASGPGWEGGAIDAEGGTCKIESPSSVTCTRSDLLGAGGSSPPITLHVKVSNAAAVGDPPTGGVTNVATVAGGGASPASASASDPTTIAAAVPFGIQSFSTSVTDSLGSPFSQAAGHPFAASTTLLFHYTVNDEGKTETAAGSPKDIETELPPGFVGDPQNTPKCPSELAQHTPYIACPTNTAVGFATPGLGESAIEGGTAHPFGTDTFLVYSLAPTPGSPAQFAFQDSAFFAINAKLRSDGDYGITVGDNATGRDGGHGLQSLNLTLCSYGVTDEGLSATGGGKGAVLNAKCASPTAGAAPFLTNPAKCSGGAPVTTLSADTYQEPSVYVSKTVYNGTNLSGGVASATESFLTGCDQLQFNPEVEFKPSSTAEGGTTQADEPTGATFALKVPQTNEAGVNATPELKNATVTLPEGMTVDPSVADGLEACSNAQFGLGSTVEPAEPAACPLASQVGTVKIVTPLLEKPLEGQVFIGE